MDLPKALVKKFRGWAATKNLRLHKVGVIYLVSKDGSLIVWMQIFDTPMIIRVTNTSIDDSEYNAFWEETDETGPIL